MKANLQCGVQYADVFANGRIGQIEPFAQQPLVQKLGPTCELSRRFPPYPIFKPFWSDCFEGCFQKPQFQGFIPDGELQIADRVVALVITDGVAFNLMVRLAVATALSGTDDGDDKGLRYPQSKAMTQAHMADIALVSGQAVGHGANPMKICLSGQRATNSCLASREFIYSGLRLKILIGWPEILSKKPNLHEF
ncbi:hypothetical protein [Niveispirillum sp.]|uniref:hypothetical protein n=1 Tax=Niveispirillum sp. TaxID=1917217 RepID=UPI001B4A4C08|nr:hypothetical protein [Niveispirillum sp.]MBP7334594.1 hypothetical protein [Niveispirillum sp.]